MSPKGQIKTERNAVVFALYSFFSLKRLAHVFPKAWESQIEACYITLNYVHELTNNITTLFFCSGRFGEREGGEVREKAGKSL